jgi:hypothetical protein
MSYDLMVFAPEAAPAKRPAFLDWYDAQTEWEDDEGDDPAVATRALQAFHAELSALFAPPAGGADAAAGTEYAISPGLIYISFHDWERIEEAHDTVFRLAAKHALGFFDVSSDLAETWLPDRKGGLRIAHSD